MEKRHLNNTIILTVIFILFIIVFAITMLWNLSIDKGLDVEAAQKRLATDYDDIAVVLQFLIGFEYEDIYISDTSGRMLVGLQSININDKQVVNAINNLLSKKGYVDINKCGGTISFTQWMGVRDVSYGVAYSMDGKNNLKIQFLTEIVGLDKPNWYYFICDYEKWREEHVTCDKRDKGTVLLSPPGQPNNP